jgi:hypothetical protein
MKKTVKNKAKNAPPKQARAKKRTAKNLSQTHGKLETEEFAPTTLDQVWGDTGMWKYDTMDAIEYEKNLKVMAKVDLQAHASRVGIVPVDNRDVLSSRLLREFKKHVTLYRFPQNQSLGDVHSKEQLSENARQILNEGK